METANSPQEDRADSDTMEDDELLQDQCGMDAPSNSSQRSQLLLKLTVAPILFLGTFGPTLSSSLITNLLLIRSCEFLNLTNCSSLKPGGSDENVVQAYVATLNMYKMIFESLSPFILAFFIGPWSDIHGRRPLMLAPLMGYCLNNILLIVFVWFHFAPIFILMTSAPLVLLGGSMAFFTGTFSYINDVAPRKDLTLWLAIGEGFLFLGLACGNIAGPFLNSLFLFHGHEAIFMISSIVCLVAVIYVVFFVPESIPGAHELGIKERLKALLDWRLPLNLFEVCFGYHEGFSRPTRLILVVISLLSLIILEGSIAVSFLYAQTKYSWDLKQYSIYTDTALIIGTFGTLCGTMVFSKLSDAPVACSLYFVKAIGYVIAGLGSSGWCMYLSSLVVGLGGATSPLTRAIISDTVPKDDIGKLFAIIAALTTGAPIVAGFAYTTLYNSTLNYFPGAVFLFSAALSAMNSILLGVIIFNPHLSPPSHIFSNEN